MALQGVFDLSAGCFLQRLPCLQGRTLPAGAAALAGAAGGAVAAAGAFPGLFIADHAADHQPDDQRYDGDQNDVYQIG